MQYDNPVEFNKNAVMLHVRLSPKASSNKIIGEHNCQLKVQVTQPPEKGKANAALIQIIAKTLHIAKSDITIVSGETSRNKTLQLPLDTDLTPLNKYF